MIDWSGVTALAEWYHWDVQGWDGTTLCVLEVFSTCLDIMMARLTSPNGLEE